MDCCFVFVAARLTEFEINEFLQSSEKNKTAPQLSVHEQVGKYDFNYISKTHLFNLSSCDTTLTPSRVLF